MQLMCVLVCREIPLVPTWTKLNEDARDIRSHIDKSMHEADEVKKAYEELKAQFQ